MRAQTDVYIDAKPGKRSAAERYWKQRSRFLLPHKLWLPLARVSTVALSEPTLGSIWTPCRPRDNDSRTGKAICCFLNSSPGLLAILGARDNRKPSYPSFSLDALRNIPIPRLSDNPDARDRLAAAFDLLQDEALLPLPKMHHDPVRIRIDQAVTEVLGLDPEWVARIRRELSREPSITNRRYADEVDQAS